VKPRLDLLDRIRVEIKYRIVYTSQEVWVRIHPPHPQREGSPMGQKRFALVAWIVTALVVGFLAGRIRITPREEQGGPLEPAKVQPAETPVPGALDASVPTPLHTVAPRYPEAAREEGIQGDVFIRVFVDTTGSVVEAEVFKSAHPALDSAALAAAREWTFTPAVCLNRPVSQYVCIPVRFVLENK
jgi:TonB family protein